MAAMLAAAGPVSAAITTCEQTKPGEALLIAANKLRVGQAEEASRYALLSLATVRDALIAARVAIRAVKQSRAPEIAERVEAAIACHVSKAPPSLDPDFSGALRILEREFNAFATQCANYESEHALNRVELKLAIPEDCADSPPRWQIDIDESSANAGTGVASTRFLAVAISPEVPPHLPDHSARCAGSACASAAHDRRPPPSLPPEPTRPLGWLLPTTIGFAVAGAAVVALGTYYELEASKDEEKLKGACPEHICSAAGDSKIERWTLRGEQSVRKRNWCYGIGGAAAAAAMGGFVASLIANASDSIPNTEAACSPEQCTLTVWGTF